MQKPLDTAALQQLFTEARTHHAWLDRPVAPATLRELYDLLKWAPTALNAGPARFVFVTSAAGKEKLFPALMGSNVGQVRQAPVTVIVAQDTRFYEKLPTLFPVAPQMKDYYAADAAASESTAFRNSSLQGAYLMLAARSLGLDVGPMSGFDNAKVDEAFLAGTGWKSNFLINLGYGDAAQLYPRGPRLEFEQVARIV